MVTVPRYRPQVEPAPLPGLRPSPAAPIEAFGGGQGLDFTLGQAVGAARDAQEERLRVHQNVKTARAQEFDTKLSFEETRIRGELAGNLLDKAAPAGEKALGDFEKFHRDLEREIEDPDVKLFVRKSYLQRLEGLNRAVSAHVGQEGPKYELVKLEGLARAEENAVQAAALNDPDRVNEAIQRARAAFADYGLRNAKRLEDGWAETRMTEVESRFRRIVAERMMDAGQDLAAKDYLKNWRENLLGTDIAAIEKDLERASTLGEAYRQHDRIMEKNPVLGDALREAGQIEDPQVRRDTESLIRQSVAQRAAAREADQEALYERAARMIDARPGGDPRTMQELTSIVSRLDSKYRDALSRRAEPPRGDPQTFLRFMGKSKEDVAKMTPAEFEVDVYSRLGTTERDDALRRWTAARDRKPEKWASLQSDLDMVLSAAKSAAVGGIKHGNTLAEVYQSPGKSAAFGELKAEVDNAFAAHHQATGKNPNDAEKKKIIGDLIVGKRVVTLGEAETFMGIDWLNPDTVKELGKIVYDDIPRADRETIGRQLANYGNVSERRVLELFKLSLLIKEGVATQEDYNRAVKRKD